MTESWLRPSKQCVKAESINELFNLVVFILKVKLCIHLVATNFHDNHDMIETSVCRFSLLLVWMIFGWKAMYHYTCQESTFLIAFAWSFAIFACIKNCLHLTAHVISAACKTIKLCAASSRGLSDLSIHVAWLPRKSYCHCTYLQFEWRISNTKIVSYQFINTAQITWL
mgnify:CR=1 FL=1